MASPSPSSSIAPSAVDSFWAWTQTSLGSAIVGGIVVLLVGWVASLIYKQVSGKSVWPNIRDRLKNAIKWLGGLRVSTAARRESDIDRAKMKLTGEIKQLEGQIFMLQSLHNAQREKSKELANELESLKLATTRPGPQPRWMIALVGQPVPRGAVFNATVELQNTIDESTPTDIRVDGTWGADVSDSGFWAQLPDVRRVFFTANISKDGAMYGATFSVSWSDPSGERHSTSLELGKLGPR